MKAIALTRRLVVLRALRWALCAGAFWFALHETAAAQSCHSPSLRPTTGLTYRAALTSTFASFGTGESRGEYQGLFATFSVAHPWFVAEIALPGYRIARTGNHNYGLGDIALSARAHLYRSSDDALIAGPELAVTLPSGSADADLGMGHVMLMPGAFAQFQHAGLALIAQVAYGRALAGAGAHHHMGPMPLVNPMNRSELTHAIGVSAALHANLRVSGRLIGAVHVFDHSGSAREIVAPGLQLILGAFDVALELQLPVLGRPFESRSVINLGAQW
jgi:hypothetical protein